MPRYTYVAHDTQGTQLSGAIGASSRRDALSSLINRQLTPIQLREEERDASSGRRIKSADVASFFEMLSDLLASGMPLAKAMDVLCDRTSSAAMRNIVESVRDEVVDGGTLSEAMGQHAEVFRPITLSLIQAGEQGAFLEQSLEQLSRFTRREQELRGRVLSALAYPIFLLIVGLIVMVGMMVFFVPKFEPLFERMASEGELPYATTALLGSSEFLRSNLPLIGVGILAIAMACLMLTSQTTRRATMEKVLAGFPLIGPVLVELAIARFARIFGTMLNGGVPIVRALEIARHSMGNQRLASAVLNASQSVQAGGELTEPLRECKLFPVELTEMIAIGEQSNRLEKVLVAMADRLEEKTKRRMDTFVKLIEPCMMVVMACLVGFLIVALLLPVFNSAGRFN